MEEIEGKTFLLDNGKELSGSEVKELVNYILNKFHEEGLTCAEGKAILKETSELIDEYLVVRN